MKNLVILGAGTAGTMAANRLARMLNMNEWQITMVDQDPVHYYPVIFSCRLALTPKSKLSSQNEISSHAAPG
jgi:NADH dehydrogenase FAD-containing subunit